MPKKAKAGGKRYRRGVGIVLLNARGQVFVAQRLDTKETAWQMPQGGIDKGETPRVAAMRELQEEIGTDKARIVGTTRTWLRYDLPENVRAKVWGGKFAGQEQKWFLMKFTGNDADIDIATAHPEFSAWKWLPFAQLPRVIVGFKRDIYRQVVAAFKDKVAVLKTRRTRTAKKKKAVVSRRPRHTKTRQPSTKATSSR